MRIKAQKVFHPWWFSAQAEPTPRWNNFYAGCTVLPFSVREGNTATARTHRPVGRGQKGRYTLTLLTPKDEDVDRSQCQYCQASSAERRLAWCGPLQPCCARFV
ncbi:hypothetical protein HRR83_008292 [Exophiala dermatitidis]|uniref:Uncharacterized protein n=1 Tax=Exophiala dermatitidis TaxID=5970 RepID=A0AAN6EM94_EXODE|nr:hypothetical protein HRR73_007919 [Exophiala dermatitidis]KAJ4507692.1 hypothetical protein HRR74_008020 [Exophiala dermatitidis]KAJ4533005.1 hypothetical protein HRR76_007975 [Exophiala dermatitidis]KAJ4535264.1 hypothetical protein HRR77_008175 [Exophiala dermatitidis]KAJ4560714.1 hypothetical protein HRR79_007837 [Exophiala dermatitidis]